MAISRGNEKLDLLKEPPVNKSWVWVCESLQSGTSQGDRCDVNMVDNIIIHNGRPTSWAFTNKSGQVLKKGESKLALENIIKQFSKTALSYGRKQNPEKMALVVQESDPSRNQFVPADQALEYLRAPSATAISIQSFVPPKGGLASGQYANYRCEYLLDQRGRHVTRSFKLGVATGFTTGSGGVTSGHSRNLVKSMDSSLNKVLSDNTMRIVRHVQRVKKCKVRQTYCDYVVDTSGDIWFTRTASMKVVSLRAKKALPFIDSRPNSSENNRRGRRSTSNRGRERSKSPPIKKEQLERLSRKAEQPGGMQAMLRHARDTMAHPVAHLNGRVSMGDRGKKKMLKGTALGSSQRDECIGDFCSYDVSVNFTELDAQEDTDPLTEARKKLNTRDMSTLMHRLGETGEIKSGEPAPKNYNIPYYWVPRARAERTLVNLMLRRHKHGEKGDYLGTMDNTHVDSDILGQNYPSHFYKNRVVCEQCFKVYKLIDVERDKAMDKLHHKQDLAKSKRLGTSGRDSKKSPPRLLTGGSFTSSIRTNAWDQEGRKINAGMKEGKQDAVSEGLSRAEQAIACLTKGDVAELRSFSKPPPAVMMVVKALMVLLTGEAMDWKSAKRVMASGERFLQMMGACMRDRERLPESRIRTLRRKFTNNPNFHPDCVEPISRSAARFCAWVLGIVQYHGWATGTAHPRIDPLRPYSAPNESGIEGDSSILFPPVHETGSLMSVYGTATVSGLQMKDDDLSFAEKLTRKKNKRKNKNGIGESSYGGGSKKQLSLDMEFDDEDFIMDGEGAEGTLLYGNRARSPIMPEGLPPTRERSLSPVNRAFGRHSSLPSAMSPLRTGGKTRVVDEYEEIGATNLAIQKKPKVKLTKKQKRARAKIQARQMKRLAGGDEGGGESTNATEVGKSYLCVDGQTEIPYEVMGTQELEGNNVNFIVLHDFFDTMEGVQIFFQRLVKKYVGCQVLILNMPGQGDTKWSATGPTAAEKKYGKQGNEPVINNQFCADKLHEVLQHVEKTGEFTCSIQQFYLMGIGNGGSIATNFACRYGSTRDYAPTFKSLVLFNGYAYVDNQLAAILHSSVNVFSCFPESRPDLPISYFTRFLFSDAYLQKVDPNLVLNIYTAVANKISLDGRIAICKGALRHIDMRPQLKNIKVPIVLLQSTENVLIAPTNVDPYLEGRSVMHLWSHQHTGTGISSRAHSQLRECLTRPGGRTAFVMWLRAGHEVRQESKSAVFDLLTRLADPGSSVPTQNTEETSGKRGKKGKKKKKKVQYVEDPMFAEEEKIADIVDETKEDDVFNDVEQTSADLLSQTVPNKLSQQQDENSESAPKKAVIKSNLANTAPAGLGKKDISGSKKSEEIAEEEGGKKTTKFEEDLMERRRKERLEETDKEFQDAMRAHKQAVSKQTEDGDLAAIKEANRLLEQAEEDAKKYATKYDDGSKKVDIEEDFLVRERKEKEALKAKGGLDQGISTRPTLGHGLRTLAEEKAELKRKLKDFENQRIARRKKEEVEMSKAIEDLKKDTKQRRQDFMEKDKAKLRDLEKELEDRRKRRELEDQKRRAELSQMETDIIARHKAEAEELLNFEKKEAEEEAEKERKQEELLMTPAERLKKDKETQEKLRRKYEMQMIIAKQDAAKGSGLSDMFGDMEKQDEEMKRMGIMKMDEYERVKSDLVMAEVKRKEMEAAMAQGAAFEREAAAALVLQAAARGMAGRKKAEIRRNQLETEALREISAIKMQCVARGHLGRKRAKAMRFALHRQRMERTASVKIQKVFRGMKGRKIARNKRERRAAIRIQKVYRGHLGRLIAEVERQRLARIALENKCATKLQATFRMYKGRMEFIDRRVREVAAVQIQRIWRGVRGRRKAARKRKWESTAPGPDRLKLGLTLIEETKEAFQTQQEEINALHRAQERSEARVSEIHEGLKESEEELRVLERELADIDQLDRDLHELTHERAMLEAKAQESEEQAQIAMDRLEDGELGGTQPGTGQGGARSKLDPAARRAAAKKAKKEARERAAEAYALEMAIHLKRAERERKKKELEAEFAGVFAEVEKKKNELARLENRIADMEATRKRKDREFVRLQRNLMELLEEQKVELDSLREKGIELETATATSAAAAAATAHAAKENERRSRAMFENTEELMKFQFMSMSLSYFSSLNMIKSLRDINADTTSAAVSSSAQTAAAAAAAAAAANIPELKHLKLGTEDLLDASTKKKQQQIIEQKRKAEEQRALLEQPFPEDVADWTVEDVSRWLDTISLSQYKRAFAEAAVDGQFLTELRNEDLRDVLGVEHELHRKKIGVMIEKLKPLDKREVFMRDTVLQEEKADNDRQDSIKKEAMPTTDSVFSMCRNGRYKRLEAALDLGFPIDTVDSHGNTLLSLSCQQVNQRIVEMLLDRRANINHQNNLGNTPLHYAMAYEPEGSLGEYLIGRGADDMIENNDGLSPYDGIE